MKIITAPFRGAQLQTSRSPNFGFAFLSLCGLARGRCPIPPCVLSPDRPLSCPCLPMPHVPVLGSHGPFRSGPPQAVWLQKGSPGHQGLSCFWSPMSVPQQPSHSSPCREFICLTPAARLGPIQGRDALGTSHSLPPWAQNTASRRPPCSILLRFLPWSPHS